MKEKIVVLNSGGLDSIVLLNYLRFFRPDVEIHSLYFEYGELNSFEQKECVDKVCKKINAVNKTICLPRFSWTKGDFYNRDSFNYTGQYLEYRNMVFISYAVSYAEAIGAKEIHVATIYDVTQYKDNSDVFYRGINQALTGSDIYVISLLSGFTKEDFKPMIKKFGITPDDFFSCDVPVDNKPCGVCEKCRSIQKLF